MEFVTIKRHRHGAKLRKVGDVYRIAQKKFQALFVALKWVRPQGVSPKVASLYGINPASAIVDEVHSPREMVALPDHTVADKALVALSAQETSVDAIDGAVAVDAPAFIGVDLATGPDMSTLHVPTQSEVLEVTRANATTSQKPKRAAYARKDQSAE